MDKDQDKLKTGVFQHRRRGDFVVLWQGKEICRYASIDDFIDSHIEGLQLLDANLEELLEGYYKGY